MGAGLCHRRALAAPEALAPPPPRAIRPCPKCGGSNRYCQYTALQETGNERAFAHLDGGRVVVTEVDFDPGTSSGTSGSSDSYYYS